MALPTYESVALDQDYDPCQNKASLNDVEHAQPPLLQPPQMSANMQLDEAHHRPFYVGPHAFPIRNYRQI